MDGTTTEYGATTIKQWLDDLVERVRAGREFSTSAGANPDRSYAYLEIHDDERHSILVFRVEEGEDGAGVRAYRFEGGAEEVRERVDRLLKGGGA